MKRYLVTATIIGILGASAGLTIAGATTPPPVTLTGGHTVLLVGDPQPTALLSTAALSPAPAPEVMVGQPAASANPVPAPAHPIAPPPPVKPPTLTPAVIPAPVSNDGPQPVGPSVTSQVVSYVFSFTYHDPTGSVPDQSNFFSGSQDKMDEAQAWYVSMIGKTDPTFPPGEVIGTVSPVTASSDTVTSGSMPGS